MCHECGTLHKLTKDLSVREWTCPDCGHYHDRDENAALNIRDEAVRIYCTC
jgi:putative transposase